MRYKTIYIPEGNDFAYCVVLEGVDVSRVSDVHAFVNNKPIKDNEVPCTLEDGYVRIPFSENMPTGFYNVWVEFKDLDQDVAYNIREAFAIVSWSNVMANWTKFAPNGEYYANVGGYLEPTGQGIPDAPVDGKQYARQNAAWTEVEQGGLTPEQDELLRSTNNATLQHTPEIADIKNAVRSTIYKTEYVTNSGKRLYIEPFKYGGRVCLRPQTGYVTNDFWVLQNDNPTPQIGNSVRHWSQTHWEGTEQIIYTEQVYWGFDKTITLASQIDASVRAEGRKLYTIDGNKCYKTDTKYQGHTFYTYDGVEGYIDINDYGELAPQLSVAKWAGTHTENEYPVTEVTTEYDTAISLLREILAILKNL